MNNNEIPSNNDLNSGVTPYRATGNMNTMINNPSINVNDPMNVNIQNNTNLNQSVNQNLQATQATIPQTQVPNSIPTNMTNINQNTQQSPQNQTQAYQTSYAQSTPMMQPTKKKKTIKLSFSPETKIAFIIALILLIFILFMPSIYEIF